jgi:hypothetical protein
VLFYLALAAGALLTAVLALALVREVRLRQALQTLLRQILTMWRKRNAPNESERRRSADRDADSD